MRLHGHNLWFVVLVFVALLACGCPARYYKADADREVYRLVARKQQCALGQAATFTIEPPERSPAEDLRGGANADPPAADALSPDKEAAEKHDGVPPIPGAVRLSLREALELAARHSREYRAEKEKLYLTALALTAERDQWEPRWTGVLNASATDGEDYSGYGAGSNFSVKQLLALGGEVTVGLATDLMRYTKGGPTHTATSLLTIEVLQPLWRNAGRRIARESLTQAEREAIYAVRAFERFRKTFCVDVTSRYYRILQQRDVVQNQWRNYLRLRRSRQDTEAMAEAGELPKLQVDQARQDELAAEARWVSALRQYREQLDQFKLALGLPMEVAMELDPGEIDRLRQLGLREVGLDERRAVEVALSRRLDLLTAADRVGDAERKVEVARNGLAPDAELQLTASVPSDGLHKPARLKPSDGTYSAGLSLGLPLERTVERNAYRESLIGLEQARRNAQQLRDEVQLSVRRDLRTLQEAARNYRIQRDSVALAERRVRGTEELLRRGEATTRDLLEANRALVDAQNALTQTLIDHALARLALWRDTELLQVDEHGVWREVEEDVGPKD